MSATQIRDIETMASCRYFYFKNGDAVAQMNRIRCLQGALPDGGPDAFLADLLASPQVGTMFLCSFAAKSTCAIFGDVSARTFCQDTGLQKLISLFKVFFAICKYRPQRILCGRAGAALAVCWLAGFVFRTPVVFSAHTGVAGQREGVFARVGDQLDAWFIRHTNAVICHGPYLEQQILAIGVPQSRLFPFDSGCRDLAGDLKDPPLPPAGSPHLLYLGRVTRGKGIFDLLHAFSELASAGLDVRLDYAGDGADLVALKTAAKALKLGDRVSFLGSVEHASVASVIRRAWGVVTPTRSELPEGRCMAAMEALAIGVPVVAPDAGPFPFLVQHGVNGLLFAQDSVDGLAAALRRLVAEAGLRSHLSEHAFNNRNRLIEPETRFGVAQSRAFSA